MTTTTPATFDPALLLPGDVLLMRGQGAISDLICWFADSPYSHAAIMVSHTDLVEAAAPVARRKPLRERLEKPAGYAFIDAWRPTLGSGLPLQEAERLDIAGQAIDLIGQPYPVDELLLLAVYGALRNRVPTSALLRWALREVLRAQGTSPEAGMVCSQLVYAAMRAAGQAPLVIVSAELDLPFPDVDWRQLWKEWCHAHGWDPSLPVPAVDADALRAA